MIINVHNRKQQLIGITLLIYGLTTISTINALTESHSFLQWSVKMTQGSNFIVLSSFVLINSLLLWQFFNYVLFGELRLIEQEHIFERLPLTVISLVMMASSFNDKQILTIVYLAGILLVMKVSHWILNDRLEGLLQTISDRTRLINLIVSNFTRNMIIFSIIDYYLFSNYYYSRIFELYAKKNQFHDTIVLIFGIEFAIVFLDYINILGHAILDFYAFHYSQIQSTSVRENIIDTDGHVPGNESENESESDEEDDSSSNEFEGKFIYEKSIDFITRLLKTFIHLSILIPLKFQSIFLKDLIWDLLILIQNGQMLYNIYKNNKKLKDKLPTITIWDLRAHDNTCIVCMDNLVELSHSRKHELKDSSLDLEDSNNFNQSDIDAMKKTKIPKILPCGHMLHFACLKNWMERSQTCPICRVSVFDKDGNIKPVTHQPAPAETNISDERRTLNRDVIGSSLDDMGPEYLRQVYADADNITSHLHNPILTPTATSTPTSTPTVLPASTAQTDEHNREEKRTVLRRKKKWFTFLLKKHKGNNESHPSHRHGEKDRLFDVTDANNRRRSVRVILESRRNPGLKHHTVTIPNSAIHYALAPIELQRRED